MVDIFGKEGVEDMFDRAGQSLKRISEGGLTELSDDPRGFKYAVPEIKGVGEYIFAPRTVDEMKKLADAGYSNLRFFDAGSRNVQNRKKPTYNYVFFDDDVMPKIVDKKQDGGLVSLGLGSV